VRALAEDSVEVLGGFDLDPPGWIVRVKSRWGASWNVLVCPTGTGYLVKLIERIPWDKWTGGKSPLYQGDSPERYAYLRSEMKRWVTG
jgi:hypothetical protein